MTPPGAVVAESAEAQHQQITIHPKLVELKDAQNTEDKGTCVSGKNDAQPETADAEKAPQIAFIKLFSTADSLDKLMIGLAVLGAVAGGALLPMFSLLFGKFADAFGNPDQSNFLRTIEGLALEFLYIGLGAFVAGFMDTCFWTWSGDRQANRLRGLYLASVLGQDIAYFDTSSTGTGGVLQGLNQDSGDVQSAISDKLGQLIKSVATFFTGFILAFTRGWDMTLVMLGCIPLMGVMGAFMSRTTSRAAERENAAYAKASAVAQQSISQIRTVASYTQVV
ncbi:hypothetical protein CEUSTIGMA_g12741.t1 [Chlamydomonas eustigma]|uniref:ABC transmembrane type-1 domain-containing protein n=1 Tax=Chlamydomonas eustigma TaxID=1157962 RepID=A0A250XQJ4_9CHLO|nr:hypothetical protein CEUSTIGMA_g12741.t1 [Chlamydomonas eustigma]|eukprot:GAX85324.1 hypothetical protein CEUSTIGMA_g12741.t1 [Chlamydomonas eustigma]